LGFISNGFSAIGKLAVVGVLLAAFLAGMAGVVYMSLSGSEVKVPDITGKDFVESEKELASLGLKIKKRADRASADKINTVLEQLPKPGETVKTGQMILVVVSKFGGTGDETPPSLKNIDEDDTEKIEDMISDKPKKAKSNSNTNKKKADTTRDVIANTSSTTNSTDTQTGSAGDPNKKDGATGDDAKKDGQDKKNTGPKPQNTPGQSKPNTIKPPAGEPRSRP
jgi:beta-lactam-binding protein with PASTA domain